MGAGEKKVRESAAAVTTVEGTNVLSETATRFMLMYLYETPLISCNVPQEAP